MNEISIQMSLVFAIGSNSKQIVLNNLLANFDLRSHGSARLHPQVYRKRYTNAISAQIVLRT